MVFVVAPHGKHSNLGHETLQCHVVAGYTLGTYNNIIIRKLCTPAEAKEIDSLAEKNRKIGELWRGLSIDEKEKYYSLAKEESTTGVGHNGDWKAVSKVLGNTNENVSDIVTVLCPDRNRKLGNIHLGHSSWASSSSHYQTHTACTNQ